MNETSNDHENRITALEGSSTSTYEINWSVINLMSRFSQEAYSYSDLSIPIESSRITKISLLFNQMPYISNNGTNYPVLNAQQYMLIAAGSYIEFTSENPQSARTKQGITVRNDTGIRAFSSNISSGGSAYLSGVSFQAFVTVYYI